MLLTAEQRKQCGVFRKSELMISYPAWKKQRNLACCRGFNNAMTTETGERERESNMWEKAN